MLNQIIMTAISPTILNLQDYEIAKYFKNQYSNISKSGECTYIEDGRGTKTKILKKGIIESKKSLDDIHFKEELIKISRDVKTISTNLFGISPIYNVFISQNPKKCNDLFNRLTNDKKITALSFTLEENIHIELKVYPYECHVNIIGISDTNEIINIYNELFNNNELFKQVA